MGEVVQLERVFQYGTSPVRTVIRGGEPWWVVKDVCEILELGNVTETVKRLDSDEFSSTEVIDSLGRKQQSYIVNEPGLYTLILASRKSEAKAFKRWITHEVIPAIRATGSYSVPQVGSTEDLIISLAQAAKMQAESVKDLKAEVSNLQQKQEWQDQRLEDVKRGLIDVEVPIRAQFNAAVKDMAFRRSMPFNKAFEEVYKTLSAQEHIDIKRRAENRGVRPIDILEGSDLLVKAIRLAKAM